MARAWKQVRVHVLETLEHIRGFAFKANTMCDAVFINEHGSFAGVHMGCCLATCRVFSPYSFSFSISHVYPDFEIEMNWKVSIPKHLMQALVGGRV